LILANRAIARIEKADVLVHEGTEKRMDR
jgi:hypothetical protein